MTGGAQPAAPANPPTAQPAASGSRNAATKAPSFHTRLIVTDNRHCTITGERTLPVIEAARIKPYAQQGSNRAFLRHHHRAIYRP